MKVNEADFLLELATTLLSQVQLFCTLSHPTANMQAGLHSFFFPIRDSEGVENPSSLFSALQGSSHYQIATVVIFFVLQILGGHLGVPIILLTLLLGKGLKRHPMLINFLVTWVIYSTSFCILLYLGKQFGPEPPNELCIVQAASIYGTAVMTPMAGLSFVLNLWLKLRAVTKHQSFAEHPWQNFALLAAPYVSFVVFLVLTGVLGSVNPQLVSRNRYLFYCTIHLDIVDFVPCCAAIIMFTVVAVEVLIAVKLRRTRKSFQNMTSSCEPNMHLIIRVGVFSIYSFLSLVACIFLWSETAQEFPYMIQASLPTAAFIIFGTQRDLLEAWGLLSLWRWVVRKPKA